MSKNMNKKDMLWKYKQDIINKNVNLISFPADYQKLAMSLKAKISVLNKKLKLEKNNVKKAAIRDVIQIYKKMLGE